MKNISALFNELFIPQQLLVFYKNTKGENAEYYTELFDLDEEGFPLAPHPLSVKEARILAEALLTGQGQQKDGYFLQAAGLFPANLLYISHEADPYAVWYTPAMPVHLFFKESLQIPSGKAGVPPLIWKASATTLHLYAVNGQDRPTLKSKLHHAPFFNIDGQGHVCMGTVSIQVPPDCSLEDFMALWQEYFFGSYFSHLRLNHSPIAGNIVQCWQQLMGTELPFPLDVLQPTSFTLQQLIR